MLNTLRCDRRHDRSRSRARGSLAIGALLVLAAPAWAAGDATGRYTMSPTEGGVIRLDRETGAMSFCTGKDGAWSCKEMPESENDLAQRVERLERENSALRAQAERSPAHPPASEPPAAGDLIPPAPPGDLPVPTERDVDKLFDYVEGMVRKFKERIDRLEREAQKEPDIPL